MDPYEVRRLSVPLHKVLDEDGLAKYQRQGWTCIDVKDGQVDGQWRRTYFFIGAAKPEDRP